MRTQNCERQSKGTHKYGKRREDRESLVILVAQAALEQIPRASENDHEADHGKDHTVRFR